MQEHLLELYTKYMRQAIHTATITHEQFQAISRTIFPISADEQIGVIGWSSLSASIADTVIHEQIAYFREQAMPFEWKYFSYDTPPDLPERLLAAGLLPEEEEAVMLLPIADAPEQLRTHPDHDIRRITTAEAMIGADAIHEAIWGEKNRVSQHLLPIIEKNPDSVSLYIAYVDDIAVSYGRVEFPPDPNPVASIWGGSTLPEYRRRGIYTELVAIRMQEAQSRGYSYLNVDANPTTSMPILEKLGFIRICTSIPFIWTPEKAQ